MSEIIKKLLAASAERDVSGFAEIFTKAMSDRVMTAINNRREELAGALTRTESAEPNDEEDEVIDLDEIEDDEELDWPDEEIEEELDKLNDEEYANVVEGLVIDGYLTDGWVEDPVFEEMCKAIRKSAKDRLKEETEQIDELSKDKLKAYWNKANEPKRMLKKGTAGYNRGPVLANRKINAK